MNRRLFETLKKHLPHLKSHFKVERVGIFGSQTTGRATPSSDVDILVHFSQPIGWEFIDLKDYLEQVLKRNVDLVTPRALKPQLRDRILSEVSYL